MQITIDTGRCVGAGQCVLTAPDLFDQDDRGIVLPLDTQPPEELLAAADEAVAACPSAAIRLTGRSAQDVHSNRREGKTQ